MCLNLSTVWSLQLIVLMALASGKSVVRTGAVTLHTRTAIHVAEIMTQVQCTQLRSGHALESHA